MERILNSPLILMCLMLVSADVTRGCIRSQLTYRSIYAIDDVGTWDTGNELLRRSFCENTFISSRRRGGMNTYDESGIYTYSSSRIPNDPRFRPSVSNGHVATVVHTNVLHVNGLYNGRLTESHRAVVPSTINTRITSLNSDELMKRWYAVNAKTGVYQETFIADHVTIYYRLYAHRTVAPLLVLEIEVLRTTVDQSDVTIHLNNSQWSTSPDITFYGNRWQNTCTKYKSGRINEPETDWSGQTEVHIIYDVIPERLVMAAREAHVTWTFLTSVHVLETSATEAYKTGRVQIEEGTLYKTHVTAWKKLWSRGTIELKGDTRLAKMTTGSLYYILSSLPIRQDPEWPFVGLSPNGLPWGKKGVPYYGGVFWDQDTWMYPAILALHTDLAKTLLETRKRTMSMAVYNAKTLGYTGMKYAWESRFTGIETTTARTLAKNELHINNDVTFAILQYYWATNDVSIFEHDVYSDIIIGIADFWITKLRFNETLGKYVALDVCGPDEYHSSVNNSVYTNVGVKMILQFAANLTQHRNGRLFDRNRTFKPKTNKYQYYADRIYIPYDTREQYHPEYDSYKLGTVVKQADVVLLGYPMMYNMTTEQRRKDLEVYENATDPRGPAMTWCMHTIAWLELGEPERAYRNLKKAFDNVASTFQVWSEVVNRSGAPNFITGQGGFLQAILFGYGGFRIKPSRLDVDFVMPPNVTEIRIQGLDFLGNSINFVAVNEYVNITVTNKTSESPLLVISEQRMHYLNVNVTVQIPRQKAYITREENNELR